MVCGVDVAGRETRIGSSTSTGSQVAKRGRTRVALRRFITQIAAC